MRQKWRATTLVAAAAMMGAAAASCFHSPRPIPARLASSDFRRLFAATVSISVSLPDARTRVGSGFVATTDGWIVTSSHVVSPVTGSVSVGYADGQVGRVAEVFTWAARDLAVIVPRRPPRVEPLRLADSTQLVEGDVVYACGVPFGLGRSLTRGVVDGRSVLHSRRYLVFDGILAEGLSYPGDSGGPVVAEDGRVVGVHLGSVARERRAVVPSNLVRRSLMEARAHAEVQRRRLELARVTR